jgi:hypothetical protein
MELLEIIAILLSDWLTCHFMSRGSVGPVTITWRSRTRIHDGVCVRHTGILGCCPIMKHNLSWDATYYKEYWQSGVNHWMGLCVMWLRTCSLDSVRISRLEPAWACGANME